MKGAIIMLLHSKFFASRKSNRSTKNRKSGSVALPIKIDGKVVIYA